MSPRRRRDQPPPRTGPSEMEVLRGFLDYLREAVVAKVDGAPEPQVREPGVPSGTSLLGVLQHLAAVERHTVLGEQVRSWPGTFRVAPGRSVADVVADYRTAVAAADAVLRDRTPTDVLPQGARRGDAPTVRRGLVHLLEETGRHAGHLDILRELVDGRTGR